MRVVCECTVLVVCACTSVCCFRRVLCTHQPDELHEALRSCLQDGDCAAHSRLGAAPTNIFLQRTLQQRHGDVTARDVREGFVTQRHDGGGEARPHWSYRRFQNNLAAICCVLATDFQCVGPSAWKRLGARGLDVPRQPSAREGGPMQIQSKEFFFAPQHRCVWR